MADTKCFVENWALGEIRGRSTHSTFSLVIKKLFLLYPSRPLEGGLPFAAPVNALLSARHLARIPGCRAAFPCASLRGSVPVPPPLRYPSPGCYVIARANSIAAIAPSPEIRMHHCPTSGFGRFKNLGRSTHSTDSVAQPPAPSNDSSGIYLPSPISGNPFTAFFEFFFLGCQ